MNATSVGAMTGVRRCKRAPLTHATTPIASTHATTPIPPIASTHTTIHPIASLPLYWRREPGIARALAATRSSPTCRLRVWWDGHVTVTHSQSFVPTRYLSRAQSPPTHPLTGHPLALLLTLTHSPSLTRRSPTGHSPRGSFGSICKPVYSESAPPWWSNCIGHDAHDSSPDWAWRTWLKPPSTTRDMPPTSSANSVTYDTGDGKKRHVDVQGVCADAVRFVTLTWWVRYMDTSKLQAATGWVAIGGGWAMSCRSHRVPERFLERRRSRDTFHGLRFASPWCQTCSR